MKALGPFKLNSEAQYWTTLKYATLSTKSSGAFQASTAALSEVPEINAHQAFQVGPKSYTLRIPIDPFKGTLNGTRITALLSGPNIGASSTEGTPLSCGFLVNIRILPSSYNLRLSYRVLSNGAWTLQ